MPFHHACKVPSIRLELIRLSAAEFEAAVSAIPPQGLVVVYVLTLSESYWFVNLFQIFSVKPLFVYTRSTSTISIGAEYGNARL